MKNFLTITCGSFTVVMLLFILLSPHDLAPYVTNPIALQIFIMSVSIAFIMVIAERLKIDSMIGNAVIKVIICYAVVFFEGAFFGMIRFTLEGLLQITPSLVPAFIITYLIQYLMCVKWASHINNSIKHKK